jgi:hypothetical protein
MTSRICCESHYTLSTRQFCHDLNARRWASNHTNPNIDWRWDFSGYDLYWFCSIGAFWAEMLHHHWICSYLKDWEEFLIQVQLMQKYKSSNIVKFTKYFVFSDFVVCGEWKVALLSYISCILDHHCCQSQCVMLILSSNSRLSCYCSRCAYMNF